MILPDGLVSFLLHLSRTLSCIGEKNKSWKLSSIMFAPGSFVGVNGWQ